MKVGSKVPDFSQSTTGGAGFRLKDMAGKKLVIYFYPKDMTAGCTRESQEFRDLHAAFRKAGARIIGVSRDSLVSHEKFKAREKLPFELLADEDAADLGLHVGAGVLADAAGDLVVDLKLDAFLRRFGGFRGFGCGLFHAATSAGVASGPSTAGASPAIR